MENRNIVSIAFAAVLALTGEGVHAENTLEKPSTSTKVIYPDLESNTYHQVLPGMFCYSKGGCNTTRRVVDCTLGTLHHEMVIGTRIAQGGDNMIQPTAPISVTSLSPKAQETIRRNCSSNGLQALF